MSLRSRTFRVFVSSTFDDLRAERNALQDRVFPRLRKLCENHGCRFQAIDLRWGVSEEAGLDQQAMNICLRELSRCQSISPRVNFIALLGERYGWMPLPPQISAHEFEKLLSHLPAEQQARLKFDETASCAQQGDGNGWYRLDENALPEGEYVLLPRLSDSTFADSSVWEKEESDLLTILRQAAERAFPDLSDERRNKYVQSAVHQEIQAGILSSKDAHHHAHVYFRENQSDEAISCCDSDAGIDTHSPDTIDRLTDLKTQLTAKLPESHVHRFTNSSEESLASFCKSVECDLGELIKSEISQLNASDPLEDESAAHHEFALERARHFVGRHEILDRIKAYLADADLHPLFLHGESGSGKTALLGKVWLDYSDSVLAEESIKTKRRTNIIVRFIGATPGSSSLRLLLIDLGHQIELRVGQEISEVPDDINKLVGWFQSRLALATPSQPIALFIDALDQLGEANDPHTLFWLPRTLPGNVKLVLAVLERPNDSAGRTWESAEHNFLSSKALRVDTLSVEEGEDIMIRWLAEPTIARQLTIPQYRNILEGFRQNGLPLWLRFAFDEARSWRSFDAPRTLPGDVAALIECRLKELAEPKYHGLIVEKVLGYLAAAQNGLSESEILEVLPLDQKYWQSFMRNSKHDLAVHGNANGVHVPAVLWARLHADLASYLSERSADNSTLFTFYHRLLGDAVVRLYLGKESVRQMHHQTLARYFKVRPLQLRELNLGREVFDLRKLSELAWQQTGGRMWDDLTADTPGTLCDLIWVQASCKAGVSYQLSDDYQSALSALPELLAERKVEDDSEKLSRLYTRDLINCLVRRSSGVTVPLPEPPPCVSVSKGLSEGSVNNEQHNETTPDRTERLQYFANFFAGHRQVLTLQPGETLPLARNQAESGVVSEQAERLISEDNTFWFARESRPKRPPLRPVCLGVLVENLDIKDVALSADGTRALAVCADKTMRLWDTRSGACLTVLEGHPNMMHKVVCSHDGTRALSCSKKNLQLWDLDRGVCLTTLEGHMSVVSAIAMSADNKRAISCTRQEGEPLRFWDLETKTSKPSLMPGHTGGVNVVAMSADGRRAPSGSRDKTLRLWDTESGNCLRMIEGHSSEIMAVALSADGTYAFSGSRGRTLRFWDTQSGACLEEMQNVEGVRSVALNADSKLGFSGSDMGLQAWNMQSGECLAVIEGHAETVMSIACNVDGSRVLSAGGYEDKTLRLWNIRSGDREMVLEAHVGRALTIASSPNTHYAVSGSFDQTLRLWNTETGECRAVMEGHNDTVGSVSFSADGKRILSGSWDDTLRIWDVETQTCLSVLQGHVNRVWTAAFSPDGNYVLSGAGDNTVRIWDSKSGQCVSVLNGHTMGVERVAWSVDGTMALSGSTDHTLRVWDARNGDCLAVMVGHTEGIKAIAWNADGSRVLSGSTDKTIRIWDSKTGQCELILDGHKASVSAAVWSNNGLRILSGSDNKDGSLRLWDSGSGQCLVTMEGHSQQVIAVSMTAEGTYAVSGSFDGSVRIWELKDGNCLATYHAGAPIDSLDISFRTGRVICGCTDGQVHVITIRNW